MTTTNLDPPAPPSLVSIIDNSINNKDHVDKLKEQSLLVLRFAVFSDTFVSWMLNPNYAIMANQGSHPGSFASTQPFAFSSATYFMPMSVFLGVAISSTITGILSDKFGRRPILLFCSAGSMVGCIIRWLCRGNFWSFCIASFVAGLFHGTTPVALASLGDFFTNVQERQRAFSTTIALWVLGMSAGGLISVLMFEQGLFAGLWIGAAMMLIALGMICLFFIEPKNLNQNNSDGDSEDASKIEDNQDDEENALIENDGENSPPPPQSTEAMASETSSALQTIDKGTMSIIIMGVFADLIGSKALFPMCISPLAFEIFHKNFVDDGELPILSLGGFQWLNVVVGLLILPVAVVAPKCFSKIGLAGSCVVGNIITGLLIVILLVVANLDPPSMSTLITFVVALHVGFPFTVLSQLSGSPMMDRLAPPDKRGMVQGIYTTTFNVAGAIAPWLLGLLADATSTNIMIWTGAGISFGAALVNSPLLFMEKFGPRKAPVIPFLEMFGQPDISDEEEVEWEEKIQNHEYVPAKILNAINMKRLSTNQPILIPSVGTYDDDKSRISEIKAQAVEDFSFLHHRSKMLRSRINDENMPKLRQDVSDAYAQSMEGTTHEEMGKWFGEYMKQNGYVGPATPQTMKAMIIKAFPPLNKEGIITVDNFEQTIIRGEKVFGHYVSQDIVDDEEDDDNKESYLSLFSWPRRIG
jgi:MFS family permease